MNEIWKGVKGFEGVYQVSNKGRIKSLSRVIQNGGWYDKITTKEKILTPSEVHRGYFQVPLHRDSTAKRKLVHRLVAEAFIPNPKNKETVNHKDGNPSNNIVSNLEWATMKENHEHATKNGLKAKGQKNGASKLKRSDVLKIREMRKNGNVTQKEIAEIFSVHPTTISNIIRRTAWRHI